MAAATPPIPETDASAPDQLALDFGHAPSHDEADYIVGSGNQLAYAHVHAYPHWPGPLTLLVGPPQSGKSHLARIWAEKSRALLAGPEDIVGLAQAAGRTPLVLEDVDSAFYDEVALFNLLNQSMRDGRSVLMTARTAVAEWRYGTEDLLSRARLAATFPVSISDDIELSQMFLKLFGDRQVQVDSKVVSYLVARMERSASEVALLVERLDRMALARRTAITRALAAEVLATRRAELGHGDGMEEGELDE